VRASTLERFHDAFAPVGFRREAFYPCYGLAEATLMVSGGRRGDPPRVAMIDGSQRVACGTPRQDVAIVGGEIWVRGASVGQGYFGQPEASRASFAAEHDGQRWLRTGDLGRLVDGELFVTGRVKDLVIKNGVKLAAEDLEHSVERRRIEALRPGACVAFSHDDGARERLVVVHELEHAARAPCTAIADAIAAAIVADHGTPADVVALVRPGTIPRTTSGKVRRGACRVLFADGVLAEVHRRTRPGVVS
jgi:acyl-CoA synthetase (AMP-forming)/AMP-acid ligase II